MIDLFQIGEENRRLSKLYNIELSSVYDPSMNCITWTIKLHSHDWKLYRIECDYLNTEDILYMLDKYIHNEFWGRIKEPKNENL